jgi:hypothetical protein
MILARKSAMVDTINLDLGQTRPLCQSDAGRSKRGGAVQVRLGEEIAACPDCGATEFVHVDPGEDLTLFTSLVCATCERSSSYGGLLVQLGPRALDAARAKLQARRRGPGKAAPRRRR